MDAVAFKSLSAVHRFCLYKSAAAPWMAGWHPITARITAILAASSLDGLLFD